MAVAVESDSAAPFSSGTSLVSAGLYSILLSVQVLRSIYYSSPAAFTNDDGALGSARTSITYQISARITRSHGQIATRDTRSSIADGLLSHARPHGLSASSYDIASNGYYRNAHSARPQTLGPAPTSSAIKRSEQSDPALQLVVYRLRSRHNHYATVRTKDSE